MSFEEFKKLVKGMKAVYTSPSFLPDAESVKIWYQLLKDIPYEVLRVAVQKHMLTNRFPPTVAELRQEEALASMDEVARRAVKRLGWKELCMSENIMQDRANFRMVYEQEQNRATERAMLPEGLRKQMDMLQSGVLKAIGGGNE